MNFNSKILLRFLLIILSSIFVFACAKQVPPSGGPVDKTPPTVIATNPINGTTNFKGDELSITFSEYVDRNSIRSAIFISPYIKNINYDWDGRSVTILLNDTLKSNTTYSVIVGTEIKDLNNKNSMAEPYAFSFSTGSKIDKGEISGVVFNKKPIGTKIFLYKVFNEENINPSIVKPDYIAVAGEKGNFVVTGLANGIYKAFAVSDNNSNLLWDSSDERIGIPFKPIVLSDSLNRFSNLNFRLTLFDTTKPNLVEAIMTDKNHILAQFSKRIDSSKISSTNFAIIDSTNDKIYPILYAYNKIGKGNKILLEFNSELSDSAKLYLLTNGINDYFGNVSDSETVEFFNNEKADTLNPKVDKLLLPYDRKIPYIAPHFIVRFSEGICSDSLESSIFFSGADKRELPVKIKKINDAEFSVGIKAKLAPNQNYTLRVLQSNICDAAGNHGDSSFVKKTKTINDLAFVSVSGRVINANSNVASYVLLESLDGKANLKIKADEKGEYKFNQVLPNDYFVWAFSDLNGNGKYDFGMVEPFAYSEPFTFRSDTLSVKKRWPVKNVNINFK